MSSKIFMMQTAMSHAAPCKNHHEYYIVVLEYIRRVLHPKKTREFVHRNYGKTTPSVLHAYKQALRLDYLRRCGKVDEVA